MHSLKQGRQLLHSRFGCPYMQTALCNRQALSLTPTSFLNLCTFSFGGPCKQQCAELGIARHRHSSALVPRVQTYTHLHAPHGCSCMPT
eukprot:scaffold78195_cov24-Tisochrysis_lutea.AAC.2